MQSTRTRTFPAEAFDRARRGGEAWVEATLQADEAGRRLKCLALGTAARGAAEETFAGMRQGVVLAEGRFAAACMDLIDPDLAGATIRQYHDRIEDGRMLRRMLGRDMAPRLCMEAIA